MRRRPRWRISWARTRLASCASRPRPERASRTCSTLSSSGSRRRKATPALPRAPSSSTRPTTSTAEWWPSCGSSTEASERAKSSAPWPPELASRPRSWASSRRTGVRPRRSKRARSATSSQPLPGYKDVKPTVFAGLYPTDSDDYPDLRDALEKLKLNDASLFYEPETSQALGFGFRCGFLGLLHMEIVRERLEREFDLDLLVTAPNVAYRVFTAIGQELEVHSPADMPREFDRVEEPYIRATTIVPKDYVGSVMELNNDRRGRFDHMEYLSEERVLLSYDLPLAEIVYDYYDQLKSRTKGYASFDYDVIGF
jgi:Elongation factor G C-terminus